MRSLSGRIRSRLSLEITTLKQAKPMSSNQRQAAVRAVATTCYDLHHINFKDGHLKDLFAEHVFSERVQRDRLPKPVFNALQKTIRQGAPLDPAIADAVATAMKD